MPFPPAKGLPENPVAADLFRQLEESSRTDANPFVRGAGGELVSSLGARFPEAALLSSATFPFDGEGWVSGEALRAAAECALKRGAGLIELQPRGNLAWVPGLKPDHGGSLPGARPGPARPHVSLCPFWGPCLGREQPSQQTFRGIYAVLARESKDGFRTGLAGCARDCRRVIERSDLASLPESSGGGISVWVGGRHRPFRPPVTPAPWRLFPAEYPGDLADFILKVQDLHEDRALRGETFPEMASRMGLAEVEALLGIAARAASPPPKAKAPRPAQDAGTSTAAAAADRSRGTPAVAASPAEVPVSEADPNGLLAAEEPYPAGEAPSAGIRAEGRTAAGSVSDKGAVVNSLTPDATEPGTEGGRGPESFSACGDRDASGPDVPDRRPEPPDYAGGGYGAARNAGTSKPLDDGGPQPAPDTRSHGGEGRPEPWLSVEAEADLSAGDLQGAGAVASTAEGAEPEPATACSGADGGAVGGNAFSEVAGDWDSEASAAIESEAEHATAYSGGDGAAGEGNAFSEATGDWGADASAAIEAEAEPATAFSGGNDDGKAFSEATGEGNAFSEAAGEANAFSEAVGDWDAEASAAIEAEPEPATACSGADGGAGGGNAFSEAEGDLDADASTAIQAEAEHATAYSGAYGAAGEGNSFSEATGEWDADASAAIEAEAEHAAEVLEASEAGEFGVPGQFQESSEDLEAEDAFIDTDSGAGPVPGGLDGLEPGEFAGLEPETLFGPEPGASAGPEPHDSPGREGAEGGSAEEGDGPPPDEDGR
ncbi:MAG: hypothetical protein LBQ12_04770 [Deltaproteobacteria bacterium]|nr:hypothetical protein [Deltaproteobacteria bacterium]